MWLTILGPVGVWRSGVSLDVGPPQQRAMLAVLLARAGEVVPLDELVDALWGGAPPTSAAGIVHRYVSRLRRVLEPDLGARDEGRWIVRASGGYRLCGDAETVDLLRFRALVDRARTEPAEAAAEHLLEALRLRRGRTGADVDLRGHAVFAAIDGECHGVLCETADRALALGAAERVVEPLRAAADDDPLDEAVHERLIRALAAGGRRAAALALFAQVRARLAAELGMEPGPGLRAAHQEILRAEPAAPAHLPPAPAGFTGRAAELEELTAGLSEAADEVAVWVVGGMAGVGKTSVALRWAHQVASRFPDGQFYVDGRGFAEAERPLDPAEALRVFLAALGVAPGEMPEGVAARSGLFRSLVAGRRVLVVVDNVRDADQVLPLVPGSAGSAVVVTSRDPLTPLVTGLGARVLRLDVFDASAATTYMANRLGLTRVAAEPRAVVEIVALCHGLPLALAVVAARAVQHPRFRLTELARQLTAEAGLDAFAGSAPRADVRAVFSWSYRQLPAETARVFRCLAVHPGPEISPDAAASLAGRDPAGVLRAVRELVDGQLVTEVRPGRYALHDLLRAYGRELNADEAEPARARLVAHYWHTLSAGTAVLRNPTDTGGTAPLPDGTRVGAFTTADEVAAWYDTERQAIATLIEDAHQRGRDTDAWNLALVVSGVQVVRADWLDLARDMRLALASATRQGERWRMARAHHVLGYGNLELDRLDEAWYHGRQAERLYGETGDDVFGAHAQRVLCSVLTRRPDFDDAALAEVLARAEVAERVYTAHDSATALANTHDLVGRAYLRRADGKALALDRFDRSERLLRVAAPGSFLHAVTLMHLGRAHRDTGAPGAAIEAFTAADEAFTVIGDTFCRAQVLVDLGECHRDRGDESAAARAWQDAGRLLTGLRHPTARRLAERLAELAGDRSA